MSRIVPLLEFSVLWAVDMTEMPANVDSLRRLVDCFWFALSTRRFPSLKCLTDLTSPAIDWIVFARRNGFFGIVPSVDLMMMKRGQVFQELSPSSSDELRARLFFLV